MVQKLSRYDELIYTDYSPNLYTADDDSLPNYGSVISPLNIPSINCTINYSFVIAKHIIEPIIAGRALQRRLGISIDQPTNPPRISLSPFGHTASVRLHSPQRQVGQPRCPQEAVTNALVQRRPEQATTNETLPSNLKILDTVQHLSWIALYLTYDTTTHTKCSLQMV